MTEQNFPGMSKFELKNFLSFLVTCYEKPRFFLVRPNPQVM